MIAPAALFLVPVPLADDGCPDAVLPAGVLERVRGIRDFVVENAQTARRFLSACGHPGPIATLGIAVLDEHTPEADIPVLLAPLREGRPMGLMSEAGAPAVADPGAKLVACAHAEGIRVVPLSGPSSILLALMASGLEGQRFRFAGVFRGRTRPRGCHPGAGTRSSAQRETQIFIETPYRNDVLLDDLLRTCLADTRLAVAADLTGSAECIRSASISEWRRSPTPPGKRPAIFLLLAPARGAGR